MPKTHACFDLPVWSMLKCATQLVASVKTHAAVAAYNASTLEETLVNSVEVT